MFFDLVRTYSIVSTIQRDLRCILSQRFDLLFVCSAPSHSVYLLVISSTKLVKVIRNFLHGWFSDMGLILVAPNEIFNLSGALVSEYVSYKVANLESSITHRHLIVSVNHWQVMDSAVFSSLIKITDPILLLPVKQVEVDTDWFICWMS